MARRNILAKMAADPSGPAVNTAAIEQYVRAVQGVESLMVMDKLRQQLALQRCVDVALGRTGVSHDSGLHNLALGSPQALSPNRNSVDTTLNNQTASQNKRSLEAHSQPPPTPVMTVIPPLVTTMDSLSAAAQPPSEVNDVDSAFPTK